MASMREAFEVTEPPDNELDNDRSFAAASRIGDHSFRMHGFSAPSHRVYMERSTFDIVSRAGVDTVVDSSAVDLGAVVASRQVRFLVCLVFCQSVQAFMSYDGGATPASIEALRIDLAGTGQEFTIAEEGLLGSMDKFGIVMTSVMWGVLLQRFNTKLILTIGLGLNALSTLLFASLRSKACMFIMKFIMGGTQSLQGVWGTVWTMLMAPPDSRTTWLGFGAISAGVGNGLGTIVAGMGLANNLGYAFAFQLQAVILFALWLTMLFTPQRLFGISLPSTAARTLTFGDKQDMDSQRARSRAQSYVSRVSTPETVHERPMQSMQLQALWANGVFVYTTLWISLIMFQCSALQFYWFQVFSAKGTWAISQHFSTTMFLLVNLVFAGIGVGLGPSYFDSLGGYSTPEGIVTTLMAMRKVGLWAAVLGPLAVVCIAGKIACGTDWGPFWSELGWANFGDPWLWFTWLFVGGIYATHNGCVAVCCGINVEVIPMPLRSFSSSTEMTVRNIIGYAFGPLIPGVLMSIAGAALSWDPKDTVQNGKLQYLGFSAILLVNLLVLVISSFAVSAAQARQPRRRAFS